MLLLLHGLFGVDDFVHFLQELSVLLLFFFIAVHILEVDYFQDNVVYPIVFFLLLVIGCFYSLYDGDQVSDQQFVVRVVVDQKQLVFDHSLQTTTTQQRFLQSLIKLI